jgi:Mg-chelatase subunit ChlD
MFQFSPRPSGSATSYSPSKAILSRATLAAIFCIAFVVPMLGQSGPQENILTRDFPILSSKGGRTEAADFVIVLDRSGSMKRLWEPVRRGLISFVSSVPDGDYVSVVGFGTGVENLVVPRPLNAGTRETLIQELTRLPDPSQRNTDLGAGISGALNELNRPNGNRLKFVFFFTDFEHDPAAGSEFASRSPSDPAWIRLAERKGNEQGQNNIQAFALLLPVSGSAGRDLGLGKVVFPQMQSLVVSETTLAAWFERRKAEIARDKLKALVGAEVSRLPVEVRSVRQEGNLVFADLSLLTQEFIEVRTIRNLSITNLSGLDGVLAPMPQEPQPVVMGRDDRDGLISIPLGSVKDDEWIGYSQSRKISFEVTGTQDIEPQAEINRLDLPATSSFVVSAQDRELRLSLGVLPIWALAALTITIALFAVILFLVYKPAYLSGEVSARGRAERLSKSQKRRSLVIGNVNAGMDAMLIDGVTWRLELRSLRGVDVKSRRKGVYAKISGSTANLSYLGNLEAIPTTDWHKLPRSGSIRVGDGTTINFDGLRAV